MSQPHITIRLNDPQGLLEAVQQIIDLFDPKKTTFQVRYLSSRTIPERVYLFASHRRLDLGVTPYKAVVNRRDSLLLAVVHKRLKSGTLVFKGKAVEGFLDELTDICQQLRVPFHYAAY